MPSFLLLALACVRTPPAPEPVLKVLEAGPALHPISGDWQGKEKRVYVMALADRAVLTFHENFPSGAHCSCGWVGEFAEGRFTGTEEGGKLAVWMEDGQLVFEPSGSFAHCCYDENQPGFTPKPSRTAGAERTAPTACVTERETRIFHDGSDRAVPAGSTVHWLPDEETGSYAAVWVGGVPLVGNGDRNPCGPR